MRCITRGARLVAAMVLAVAGLSGCAAGVAAGGGGSGGGSMAERVVVSIVGTNDVHGHLESLPWLAGFMANLRAARGPHGAVILVDGGDLFQGTLESNPNEGAAVVAAYNALGYAGSAIGNHEFDYGPVGPAALANASGDDPQGALRARIREARFPFLAANLRTAPGNAALTWDNTVQATLVEAAGVPLGLIGVSTEDTPRTTAAPNFRGLAVTPPAVAIVEQARALRARGAVAVVVLAHLGGACRSMRDATDLGSCEPGSEVFELARALPQGLVDVVVAGHTHQGVAHRVNGVAVIESFAEGRAFGRVDLTIERATRRVVASRILPPRALCSEGEGMAAARHVSADACHPGSYEGAPVRADAAMERLVAPFFDAARATRERPLGVDLATPVGASYRDESPLGNLVTDMMRAARPGADVAVTNGGGLRADLPAGPLRYGAIYEALPFDNRLVEVRVRGAVVRRLVARSLASDAGIVSLSGVRAVARCDGATLAVTLLRPDGRPVGDDEELVVVTSDFLASGGDGMFAGVTPVDLGAIMRDAVAAQLTARGGAIRADDPALFDPARRRLEYPGSRPVRCAR